MYLGGPVNTDRAGDAERRIMQTLLNRTTSASRGRVVIYTERTMCGQCEQFKQQFEAARPGITVDIIGGGPRGAPIPGSSSTNQGLSGFPYSGSE